MKHIFKNALYSGINPLFRMFTGLALTPLILSSLGSERFAAWKFCTSFVAIAWILQLGFNSYISREIPIANATRNHTLTSEVVSSTISFYLLVGVVFSSVLTALAFTIPSEAQFGVDTALEIRSGLLCIAAIYAVYIPLSAYRAVFTGYQQYGSIAATDALSQGLYVAAVACLCLLGNSVFALISASTLQVLLPCVILAVLAFRRMPETRINIGSMRWSRIRIALPYSMNSAIFSIVVALMSSAPIWMLSVVGTPSTLTRYSLCLQIAAFIPALIMLMSGVTKTASTELEATGQLSKINLLIINSSKFSFTATLAASSLLFIFHNDIMKLWLRSSSQHLENIDAMMALILIGQLGWVLIQGNYFILNGIGKHKFLAVTALINALLSAAIAFLGGALLPQNIEAWVAGAMNIPTVVYAFLVIPLYMKRVTELPLAAYFRIVVAKPALVLAAIALPIYFSLRQLHPNGSLESLLLMFTSGLIVLAAILFLILEQSERHALFSMFMPRRTAKP